MPATENQTDRPRSRRALAALALAAALLAAARPATAQEPAPPQSLPLHGGAISLKVDPFDTARRRILDAAARTGTAVSGGETRVSPKGRKSGEIILHAAPGKLAELLPEIRAVGTLYADNLSTSDAVSQYESLARRIKELQKHEARLDEILHSPRHMRGSDVLYIQERLYRAGVDEAMMEQQRADLVRASGRAQILVRLFEPLPAPVRPPATPAAQAQASLAHFFDQGTRRAQFHLHQSLATVAVAAAYLLVYAPLWVPVVAAALLALRLLYLRRMLLVRFMVRLYEIAFSKAVALLVYLRRNAPPVPPAAV